MSINKLLTNVENQKNNSNIVNTESTIDIDYLEDFLLAEALLNFKNEQKKLSNNRG